MMAATAAEEMGEIHPNSENNFTSLSLKITRRNQDRPWKLRFIYLQCYFVSVASILGTGILGLPVTIAHSGLQPFLVSFVIGFLMQALLIYLFIDLLQRCRVAQLETLKLSGTESILMQYVGDRDSVLNTAEEEEETEDADRGLLSKNNRENPEEECVPNLHILGVLFLSKYMSYAFNLLLVFQFISIGISYVLAGSESYAELLHISYVYVIPFFTWILALGILLAQVVIQPVTSLLTLLKGILLMVTVAVTFVVGSEVKQEISNDFSYVGKPFLMGTVALGGVVNVMPFLFSEISHNKSQIMWFRRAIIGGLTTCAVLNILWCWAVLKIVPQMTVRKVLEDEISNNSMTFSQVTVPVYTFIYSNISLEESEKLGEIATIPLTKIIIEQHHQFAWVAWFTEIFIAISITVSFLVLGSTIKHTFEGWVNSLWSGKLTELSENCEKSLPQLQKCCTLKSVVHGCTCLVAFGIIFIVAESDPKGFVVMLDKVASFTLNLEAGLFMFLMLRKSRSEPFIHFSVPLPVSERLFTLHWVLPVYFLFAVGYDIFQSMGEVAESWIQTQSNTSRGEVKLTQEH
ncbi:hypothetical protein HHUSO_G20921 [Huso huso]|uniref:Amino acid transporter transmembrane domain-containing protein n=2 Tax=Acipenseridae TaxID=7900 RepID=A0ABR0Z158_HUSHU|nr:uncharacterized protein si:ch211-51h4.2 isoform X1 [Acipenser ruthenus]